MLLFKYPFAKVQKKSEIGKHLGNNFVISKHFITFASENRINKHQEIKQFR